MTTPAIPQNAISVARLVDVGARSNPVNIYICASSHVTQFDRVIRVRDRLLDCGIHVTSRWPEIVKAARDSGIASDHDLSHRDAVRAALSDISDIRRADALAFLVPPLGTYTHGGFWEIGFAHGLGKPIFSAGPFASIFLATTEHYDRDDELIGALHACVPRAS